MTMKEDDLEEGVFMGMRVIDEKEINALQEKVLILSKRLAANHTQQLQP